LDKLAYLTGGSITVTLTGGSILHTLTGGSIALIELKNRPPIKSILNPIAAIPFVIFIFEDLLNKYSMGEFVPLPRYLLSY
jgi:hypothetical protein